MVRQNRERLSGTVEADETHIGGPGKGKADRGVAKARTKTLIAGAVEMVTDTKGDNFQEKAGRSRLAILKDAGENEIKTFLNRKVAEGSKIKSDGWKGYSVKAMAGYEPLRRTQGGPASAGKHAPHIHRAFGNLQTWLNGIHHGGDSKSRQHYRNEFVFRYNRRETPMAAFKSLLKIVASSSKPLGFKKLKQP